MSLSNVFPTICQLTSNCLIYVGALPVAYTQIACKRFINVNITFCSMAKITFSFKKNVILTILQTYNINVDKTFACYLGIGQR